MPQRFFRHGELPLVLLALLADRPMHGYDVMSELARLFGPHYRPSPGTVYPAVDALEAEGLLEAEHHNGRTIYRTTDAGMEALTERAEALAALELRTGARGRQGGGPPPGPRPPPAAPPPPSRPPRPAAS